MTLQDTHSPKCSNIKGNLFHLLLDCHEIEEIWFGIKKQAMNFINANVPTYAFTLIHSIIYTILCCFFKKQLKSLDINFKAAIILL